MKSREEQAPPPERREERGWKARMEGVAGALDRWAPWVFGAATLLLGLLIWEWFPPGVWHDDGVYVLLGRSLARGEGLRYTGVAGDLLAPKFPPLYPLALSLVWLGAPAFPRNTFLLSGLNLLFVAVAGGVFLAFLRRGFGLSRGWALAGAALAWTSPEIWRLALVPLSEPLFILMALLALWAAARMEAGGGGWRVALFVLLAMGAFYTRTMGVVILLGGVGALLLRRRWRAGALALGAGVLTALPWLLWSRRAASAIPGPLLDTLGPYGSWLAAEVTRNPGSYLGFLPENALHLAGRVLALLLPGLKGLPLWLGLLLLPVLALGMIRSARTVRSLPLTLILALGVLLLWPFQDIRLLVPFHPLLVLCLLLGFREVADRWGRGAEEEGWSGPGWAVFPAALLVGLVWVGVTMGVSLPRLATGWPGEPYRLRSRQLARAVSTISEKTPPQAVVGAPELWAGIHLFTGRRVTPSARFLPLAAHGPSWGTPEEQYELWMASGVTHILVEHGGGVHGEALDRMDAKCPGGAVQLLDAQPGQFLVRVAWDEACRTRLMGGGGGP